MAELRLVNGVWKLEALGRSTAIHGRDPQREADIAVGPVLAAGGSAAPVVAIGLGVGYLLDALDRGGWQGTVLALEPEPATLDVLRDRPIVQAWLRDSRLRILSAPTFDGAAEAYPFFGDGATEPALIVNPALARLHPETVARARALADRLRGEAASNAHARRMFSGRYLLNTLQNLQAISMDGNVADLFGAAPRVPAIVIAAGPSLDRALPALRNAHPSAVLICVDTALRPLLAAGITPHVVVSIDPSEANARHLADIPACADTCLAAEGSLDPLALAPFSGRTFFLNVSNHQPWPWIEQQGLRVGRLRAWGSVLTSAFDLAVQMDCNPIVFAGADLAYSEDRPYCRGVVFEEDWRRRAEWGVPLEQQWIDAIDHHPPITENDVHGHPVRTASHLVAFRSWLLEQMRRETGRRFFNATNGGILHGEGIEQVAFEQLPAILGAPRVATDVIRRHHRPRANDLALQVAALFDAASRGAADQTFEPWEQFAPGTTRQQMIDALERAFSASPTAAAAAPPAGSAHAQVALMDPWIRPWANTVPLVPMRIPPYRLSEWSAVGARIFYFRTMAARLIMCALQPPDGGLMENGRPLKEAATIGDVGAGTYRTCRDELHFKSSDGSDPRRNGREYALLVPPCVAALEELPVGQILEQRL